MVLDIVENLYDEHGWSTFIIPFTMVLCKTFCLRCGFQIIVINRECIVFLSAQAKVVLVWFARLS